MEWLETGVGYDITLWFNSLGEGFLNTFFKIFNITGGEVFYILVFPLIYWCINKSLGKRIMILTILTVYVNQILKNLWMRPRPYDVHVPGKKQIVNRLADMGSYGLPSGHVMGSTSFWGYLSRDAVKKSAKITCYLMVLLTAISRMVHGVHYVQDVVVGFMISILILILFIKFEPRITDLYNQEYTLLQRLLLVLFSCGAALVLVILLGDSFIEDSVMIIGGFLGAMTGIILEKEYIGFNVEGGLDLRAGRYIVGLAVIIIIYIGLENLFITLKWSNDYFRFLKYALLGFSTTYPVPKLFVILKLAQSDKK